MFALSVSPTSIRNPIFIQKVKELFSKNKKIKNKIIFLLYEKEYYSHINKYNNLLQSLRLLSIKIAIDRVASSHTSFLYIRELDIDIIRYDSLYSKETKNNKKYSIIKAFQLMAQESSLKTWMKMIESEEKLLEANNLKIDYVQGIHLAKLKKT